MALLHLIQKRKIAWDLSFFETPRRYEVKWITTELTSLTISWAPSRAVFSFVHGSGKNTGRFQLASVHSFSAKLVSKPSEVVAKHVVCKKDQPNSDQKKNYSMSTATQDVHEKLQCLLSQLCLLWLKMSLVISLGGRPMNPLDAPSTSAWTVQFASLDARNKFQIGMHHLHHLHHKWMPLLLDGIFGNIVHPACYRFKSKWFAVATKGNSDISQQINLKPQVTYTADA